MDGLDQMRPRPGACTVPPREAMEAVVRPLVVGTAHLPPHQQFEAWCDIGVPYLDVGATEAPTEHGFAATGTALPFGALMFYGASLPAYRHGRSLARIRRDSLDHWIIAVCRGGVHRQRSGDHVFEMRPGVPHVLSMAAAFEAERAGAAIEWQALFVARDEVPELEAALSASLWMPLDTPMGRVVSGFMASLQAEIARLVPADLPRLKTATKAMIAAALAPSAETMEAARPQIEHLQLARMKRLIRENVGAATLGPARLSLLGGISRSTLYRLFEPLGGVARYIHRERLDRAHRMLSDPEERRGIAEIAEANGFFEPSTFSRAFRREFGATPREIRLAALAGQVHAAGRRFPGAPGTEGQLIDLLRRL